jgi:ribosomal protein L32
LQKANKEVIMAVMYKCDVCGKVGAPHEFTYNGGIITLNKGLEDKSGYFELSITLKVNEIKLYEKRRKPPIWATVEDDAHICKECFMNIIKESKP